MSDAQKVVVVGSANVDLVMTPRDLPSPGVTVLAPTYRLLPGGKGANQAYDANDATAALPAHQVPQPPGLLTDGTPELAPTYKQAQPN